MMDEHTFSWPAILRLVTAGLIIYLVWTLTHVILIIIVSLMLASAFHPIVVRLKKYMPVTIASILVVVCLLLPLVILAFAFLPGLIRQIPDILTTVDKIINNSSVLPRSVRHIDLSQYAQNAGQYLLASTSVVTNAVTSFLTIVFLMLYLMIDSERLHGLVTMLIPKKYQDHFRGLVAELNEINGQYIRGNLFISVICGLIIFAGLFVLSVPFAASLALFAAVTDLLPLIGAIAGVIPAAIIGFSISPTIGALVIILFIVYQQFENNILAPNVYTRALDVSPALSVIAVIIGASLFGIFGAFIALPVAASIPTVVRYLREEKD